jgi:phage tail sheath protein FI
MNIDASGKSVNAIRAFTGKGILVWGARTWMATVMILNTSLFAGFL